MKAKLKSKPTTAKSSKLKDLKPKSSPKGGNIGTGSSGAGAGKITFNPFN